MTLRRPEGTQQTVKSSNYPGAIELTTATIQRRAGRYRWLVVSVVSLVFASLLIAAVSRSWLACVGILTLLPMCAWFFSLDASLVVRWRGRIIRLWANEGLDLSTFRTVMAAVPGLPPRTVAAMLQTLPAIEPMGAVLGHSGRRIVASTVGGIDAHDLYAGFATAIGLTIGITAVIASSLTGSWIPLLAIGVVPICLIVGLVVGSVVLRRSIPTAPQLQEAGLNAAEFVALASRLDWRRVSITKRQRLLNALRD